MKLTRRRILILKLPCFKTIFSAGNICLALLLLFCNIELINTGKVRLYKASSKFGTELGETGLLEENSFVENLGQNFTGTRKQGNLVQTTAIATTTSNIVKPKRTSSLVSRSIKLFTRISNDVLRWMSTTNLQTGSSNGISKRSHDSTYALIAFVTFSTFVLFTLLPLLTYPRRQRLAKEALKQHLIKHPPKLKFFRDVHLPSQQQQQYYKTESSPYAYEQVSKPYHQNIPQQQHQQQQNQISSSNYNDNNNNNNNQHIKPFPDDYYTDSVSGQSKVNLGGTQPLLISNFTDDNEFLTKQEILYLLKTL